MPDQIQRALDTRAIELAAGASAVTNQHLIECRDRYLAMERSLDRLSAAIQENRQEREAGSRRLYAMMWKGMGSLVLVLILMLGYFLTKFGLPGVHP